MNRRNFLKRLGGAGAVAWLMSGRAAAEDVLDGYGNPVSFVDPLSYEQDFQIDPALAPDSVFSLGVGSGDPRPHGIVLWTRVDPAAMADPAAPGAVAFEIASEPEFRQGSI
ncbi:MAG: PhoD-like phosphatase N-terminal domain-containing protein, partial [Thiobacillus sp.]